MCIRDRMFHFPTFPPHALYIQARVTRHHSCWVSPFGHPRITARLTAPRGLSQPPTSFIGSWCQGIHRTLFITYNKDARVHCAVLKQHTNNHTHVDTNTHQKWSGMTTCSYLSLLPRKKHSRVLSGPNSMSIYCSSVSHRGETVRRSSLSASTHELLPDHKWIRNRLCQPTIHLCGYWIGECSLERR